ncbi:MAG TPA: TetR/AcrR family transcriptional regulator [Noviherbaspirillum sp.]|nr:TetR/AcrR family transcriptional regulator [Noviherbaspirillum sp.]
MNANTSSEDARPASAGEGRTNQRRRTRRALIEAALALCEGGRKPSFPEVAERAMVSRATAYRYYSSVEDLISDAMFERAVPPLETFCSLEQDDPAEAAAYAARTMNKLLLDDEVGLHAVERSFMAAWLDNPQQSRPPRPARRMQYIGPIVDSLKNELTPTARRRLSNALAMLMGTEAALSLCDVAGASIDEALSACGWAAQALVRQALAEAREESGQR